MVKIGEYIKILRETKKYSQRKLSYVAKLSNSTISRIEKNEIIPSPETIRKISGALGADYEELLAKAGYIDSRKQVYDTADESDAKKVRNDRIRENYDEEIVNEMKRQRLDYIKDNNLRQWVMDPSNIEYLKFAKKISDFGIDPEFILNEFVIKIFKKNKKDNK